MRRPVPSSQIQLYTGTIFDPINPDPELINVTDIAHALAHQCRFSGHTTMFYSVAEHSIHVSNLCSREHALWGLLHDASEAYLQDVPSPLKTALFGERYREVEGQLMAAIVERFSLSPATLPAEVKQADLVLLKTEWRDLMPHTATVEERTLWSPWLQDAVALADRIEPVQSRVAKSAFIALFNWLSGGAYAA